MTPTPTENNVDAVKKWRTSNTKAEFVLKRSISHDLFDHIVGCIKSASKIWNTLNELFNKKNVARLQYLENELTNATQEEPISEARMKRNIIRGLKKEYTPFDTSIQGWAQEPSFVEFENLLSSQESLAQQMATISLSSQADALFSRKKKFYRKEKRKDRDGEPSRIDNGNKSGIKCYRCHKTRHIRKKI